MEYSLYTLHEEPFIGFFPQDFLHWLKSDRSDEQLAEAYMIVSNHCGCLMHMVAEDDPWLEQAYEDWHQVEMKTVTMILSRMKQLSNDCSMDKGIHYKIAPFMIRCGYHDNNSYWLKNE